MDTKKMRLRIVLSGGIGLGLGIALTMVAMWNMAPGIMLVENESKYDFQEAVDRFTASVKQHGWKMPKVHDLQKTMHKFGKDVARVKVFELCHPEHAYKILKRDDERIVSSMMPCRVAIYQRSDGKTYVSRMNTALMGQMMAGIVPQVMGQASQESESIIKSVLN